MQKTLGWYYYYYHLKKKSILNRNVITFPEWFSHGSHSATLHRPVAGAPDLPLHCLINIACSENPWRCSEHTKPHSRLVARNSDLTRRLKCTPCFRRQLHTVVELNLVDRRASAWLQLRGRNGLPDYFWRSGWGYPLWCYTPYFGCTFQPRYVSVCIYQTLCVRRSALLHCTNRGLTLRRRDDRSRLRQHAGGDVNPVLSLCRYSERQMDGVHFHIYSDGDGPTFGWISNNLKWKVYILDLCW